MPTVSDALRLCSPNVNGNRAAVALAEDRKKISRFSLNVPSYEHQAQSADSFAGWRLAD